MEIFNELGSCIQNVLNNGDYLSSDFNNNNNNKENENIYLDLDYIQGNNNISTTNNSRCSHRPHQQNQKQKQPDSNLRYDSNVKRVPFVSQISSFIAQSKKEYFNLEDRRKSPKRRDKISSTSKKPSRKRTLSTSQKEKKVMHYIDFFDSLKKELWQKYSIHFEDYIERFAKVINDFKKNDFDYSKIMLRV